MKALILAAGRGKRLDEKTKESHKCILKFNNKPLIEYSLESAKLANVSEIVIIVGYRATDIINLIGIEYKGIKISYIIQDEQSGVVHAMELAKDALGNEDFMLLLADELLINPNPIEMVKKFEKEKVFVMCGVLKVKDTEQIKKTYTIIYNENNNHIYRLIEKPRKPLNDIMGTGNCLFRKEIWDYIQYTPIHHERKEKELPDLIQCAVDDGKNVQMFFIGSDYVNINSEDDIKIGEKMFKKG